MGLQFAKLVARHDKTKPTTRSQPDECRHPAIRAKFGALAIAVAAVAASFAVIAPTPAYADTNGIEIVNAGSGLRVDVMWASTSPFQGAFLWPDNTSTSQEFDLLDSGNGFYRIRARHSGQCLMLDGREGRSGNGTKIIQYPSCVADMSAEWSTQWVWRPNGCTDQCFTKGNWYALIKNHATGRCLDAANPFDGAPGQQAVLQQWDCISSPTQWNAWNQLWSIATATSQKPPPPPLH